MRNKPILLREIIQISSNYNLDLTKKIMNMGLKTPTNINLQPRNWRWRGWKEVNIKLEKTSVHQGCRCERLSN